MPVNSIGGAKRRPGPLWNNEMMDQAEEQSRHACVALPHHFPLINAIHIFTHIPHAYTDLYLSGPTVPYCTGRDAKGGRGGGQGGDSTRRTRREMRRNMKRKEKEKKNPGGRQGESEPAQLAAGIIAPIGNQWETRGRLAIFRSLSHPVVASHPVSSSYSSSPSFYSSSCCCCRTYIHIYRRAYGRLTHTHAHTHTRTHAHTYMSICLLTLPTRTCVYASIHTYVHPSLCH
ncbi:hypothetical protein GGS23DRAFT_427162 [Durotheca rogersii]|uniref:uncharacterized protein n=1 Tax=Durotheca rogersii TaxID=419775 RepID=UPI00221ECE83|nr:uncharacterized protein GGS23DRAFT_427162 [Durotheca rogersii]KAI5865447.1 hypothetical protein GGS23DRAFT_427162 [Durotheca rogersii]